jgi:hypothetical protein
MKNVKKTITDPEEWANVLFKHFSQFNDLAPYLRDNVSEFVLGEAIRRCPKDTGSLEKSIIKLDHTEGHGNANLLTSTIMVDGNRLKKSAVEHKMDDKEFSKKRAKERKKGIKRQKVGDYAAIVHETMEPEAPDGTRKMKKGAISKTKEKIENTKPKPAGIDIEVGGGFIRRSIDENKVYIINKLIPELVKEALEKGK